MISSPGGFGLPGAQAIPEIQGLSSGNLRFPCQNVRVGGAGFRKQEKG